MEREHERVGRGGSLGSVKDGEGWRRTIRRFPQFQPSEFSAMTGAEISRPRELPLPRELRPLVP